MSSFELAQINIARFRLPKDHEANREFIESLDRVNAIAEAAPGFIWRLTGGGNDAMDLEVENDPLIAVNMSVWTSLDALATFVYQSPAHRDIMRRRREWFDRMDVFMALWWVPTGVRPTLAEGMARLERLEQHGPTPEAFTFRVPFPAPGSPRIEPVLDKCA